MILSTDVQGFRCTISVEFRVISWNPRAVAYTAMLRVKNLFEFENQSFFNPLQAEYWLKDVRADGHARGYDR